jgi:glucans biosynthesis protein
MMDGPMRQRDVERRLSNLAKAPRCGAKTRSGRPCMQAAVKGRARCRMHGGARGSGGPRGPKNGNYRHGHFTGESLAERRAVQHVIRETRKILASVR